jgi:hypothetical protein
LGYGIRIGKCNLKHFRLTEWGKSSIDIFISHSNQDVKVAKALITLLRAALNISSTKIRCTSVPGFMFDSGTPIDEQIILEVHDSTILNRTDNANEC